MLTSTVGEKPLIISKRSALISDGKISSGIPMPGTLLSPSVRITSITFLVWPSPGTRTMSSARFDFITFSSAQLTHSSLPPSSHQSLIFLNDFFSPTKPRTLLSVCFSSIISKNACICSPRNSVRSTPADSSSCSSARNSLARLGCSPNGS